MHERALYAHTHPECASFAPYAIQYCITLSMFCLRITFFFFFRFYLFLPISKFHFPSHSRLVGDFLALITNALSFSDRNFIANFSFDKMLMFTGVIAFHFFFIMDFVDAVQLLLCFVFIFFFQRTLMSNFCKHFGTIMEIKIHINIHGVNWKWFWIGINCECVRQLLSCWYFARIYSDQKRTPMKSNSFNFHNLSISDCIIIIVFYISFLYGCHLGLIRTYVFNVRSRMSAIFIWILFELSSMSNRWNEKKTTQQKSK